MTKVIDQKTGLSDIINPGDFAIPHTRLKIENELKCGIYFLLRAGDVAYVGKSTNIISRVYAHRCRGIEFDEFTYIEAPEREIDRLEAIYTLILRPSLNLKADGSFKNPELAFRAEGLRIAEAQVLADAE